MASARSRAPGSAEAAASCHSGGCPPWWGASARPPTRFFAPHGNAGVVDFVETLHIPFSFVLSALQQVMHGHGAAVVVDVVAALTVGKDALDEAGWVRPAQAGWWRQCF